MIAVAAQVLDGDPRIGQRFLDQPFKFPGVDRHQPAPLPEESLDLFRPGHVARQPCFVAVTQRAYRYGVGAVHRQLIAARDTNVLG